jgi:hypothetical protein
LQLIVNSDEMGLSKLAIGKIARGAVIHGCLHEATLRHESFDFAALALDGCGISVRLFPIETLKICNRISLDILWIEWSVFPDAIRRCKWLGGYEANHGNANAPADFPGRARGRISCQ